MQVYNDLTREKEALIAQEDGHFKIYVCGPTVYDFFHLGNARPFVVYDTLRRYLKYRGNKVCYVQNFTDIDDKMIQRANNEEISVKELADRMIKEYYRDADGLGVERADHNPRATETIDEIIHMIKALEDKGFTYVLEDGVYYDVSKFNNYGNLSRHKTEDLEEGAGHRTSIRNDKLNPNDFVLWKFKKEGEPAWPSPWGDGRPGWHIECSAMSKKFLGDTLDIHCGGQDLLFPHHENEIAQSEAANGKQFVRYWLHNGFINVDNLKMAKSDGNFFRVRDLAEKYSYAAIRFFLLQTHYRMPINFTSEAMEASYKGFHRVLNCLENLEFLKEHSSGEGEKEAASNDLKANLQECLKETKDEFIRSMDDDLNFAAAFGAIFELIREINTATAEFDCGEEILTGVDQLLRELLGVLGFENMLSQDEIPCEIKQMVKVRAEAKAQGDYAKADKIRDEIKEAGFVVEDTPDGAKIKKLQ